MIMTFEAWILQSRMQQVPTFFHFPADPRLLERSVLDAPKELRRATEDKIGDVFEDRPKKSLRCVHIYIHQGEKMACITRKKKCALLPTTLFVLATNFIELNFKEPDTTFDCINLFFFELDKNEWNFSATIQFEISSLKQTKVEPANEHDIPSK